MVQSKNFLSTTATPQRCNQCNHLLSSASDVFRGKSGWQPSGRKFQQLYRTVQLVPGPPGCRPSAPNSKQPTESHPSRFFFETEGWKPIHQGPSVWYFRKVLYKETWKLQVKKFRDKVWLILQKKTMKPNVMCMYSIVHIMQKFVDVCIYIYISLKGSHDPF